MRRLVLLVLALTAGCFEDRYRCTTDAQCDLGPGGRCERAGYCTFHDVSCATHRRYSAHAAELTDTCFDDRTELTNVCAGGQGPALPVGCVADVCTRLPACCELAWTDACAQIASEECAVDCETRMAITASRTAGTEVWDTRWSGSTWNITSIKDFDPPVGWVGPVPGESEPRLAVTKGTTVTIGDTPIELGSSNAIYGVTSVSFDRGHRDTVAIGYTATNKELIAVVRVDDMSVRTAQLPAAEELSWGDLNRDGFPDAVAKMGPNYSFLENVADGYERKLVNQVSTNVTGGFTPGTVQVRSIDWLDVNRDGALDLVVFGSSVRIHAAYDSLRDIPERDLDCSPPSPARPCMSNAEPNLEAVSFVGAALPTRDDPSIVMAQYPQRKLWRGHWQGDTVAVSQLPFPGDGCSCSQTCVNCPGGNCTCTYDCTSCVPVLAIVTRDFDGDRRLDILAIDARLRLYTALAANNFAWTPPVAIPTTLTTMFGTVTVSVTGVPR